MKKLRKISFQRLIVEIIGMTLIIYGLNRLSFFLSVIKFEKKLNQKFNTYREFSEQLSGMEISDVYISMAIYGFIGLLVTSTIIIFIKVKNKLFYIDSIVSFILVLLIFPFFIHRGIINKLLFNISLIWETNFKSMSLISFIIFTIFGTIILWRNIEWIKNTTQNDNKV